MHLSLGASEAPSLPDAICLSEPHTPEPQPSAPSRQFPRQSRKTILTPSTPLHFLSPVFLSISTYVMAGKIRAGWAVLRYSPVDQLCPPNEAGDKTWGQWFSCCPAGTTPNSTAEDYRTCDIDNVLGDSTPQTQCANASWTLWSYEDVFYCCDSEGDQRGYYYYSTGQLGCATSDWVANPPADVRDDVRRAGNRINPPANPSPSSPNKGAIAGGVVGGVCGALIIAALIWFFFRRRRRQAKTPQPVEHFPDSQKDKPLIENSPAELHDYSPAKNEMPAGPHLRHELSGSTSAKEPTQPKQPPFELA